MAADTNSFGWNGPAARLPAELWVMIAANLDLDTFSGLTRASRGFHYLLAGELIPHHVKGAKTKVDLVARISEVFVHAARIDSTRILDQLRTNYRRVVDPAGFLAPAPGQTTFLDFALAADAPRVVRHLVRTGCDIDLVALQQPPGIKQLSLTLAGCHGGRSWMAAADSALRAAIHHAMPRTVRFLLARGASANGMADGQGEPALHAALQRREMPGLVTLLVSLLNDRVRWRQGRLTVLIPGMYPTYPEVLMARYGPSLSPLAAASKLLGSITSYYALDHTEILGRPFFPGTIPSEADCLWQHRVGQTVAALLDFGAAPDTRTPPAARLHTCSRLCWRFTACHYGWETPLHLAAAAGFAEAIPPLLAKHPAGFHAPDAGGYTALYRALVKDRLDAALALLNDPCAPPNPPILVITAIPPHDGKSNPASTTTTPPPPNGSSHPPNPNASGTTTPTPPTTGSGTTTALHAASRLALFPVVHALLQRGADPNAIDPATGRAPLHELLGHTGTRGARTWDVLATLEVLRVGGADMDLRVRGADVHFRHRGGGGGGNNGGGGRSASGSTPVEMGRTHPQGGVRGRFVDRWPGWVARKRWDTGPKAERIGGELVQTRVGDRSHDAVAGVDGFPASESEVEGQTGEQRAEDAAMPNRGRGNGARQSGSGFSRGIGRAAGVVLVRPGRGSTGRGTRGAATSNASQGRTGLGGTPSVRGGNNRGGRGRGGRGGRGGPAGRGGQSSRHSRCSACGPNPRS